MERKVIIIVGPTCSGKTLLSLLLAHRLDTEIVSADSRQIYKHLDIGTAKPTIEELTSVKHHFIDYLNLEDAYNVSMFEHDALEIIESLFHQGKIPVVVGGSGLYIKALVDGIFDNAETDKAQRVKLLELRKEKGNEYLYNELKKIDPSSAEKMLPQNWKRVMRALEVFYSTGKPIGELHKEYERGSDIKFMQYGLLWDRAALYKNIEKRVDEMIQNGLVEETKMIIDKGYNPELNALNTVGYKEIISYLNNEVSLERAIELIKRNTRRYAKRQMTWFRKDKRIIWFEVENESSIKVIVEKIIKDIE